jgi:putative acyl-CoA dehydrogenase
MRRALAEARHHAAHRRAFGRTLLEQPLMRNVLADLAVESEAALILAMRAARAFDDADYPFARLAVAAGKYWITKRAVAHVAEALECLGGNGFIEECILPRLYREAPLNSIWEGSGNVIALDLLRTVTKAPESLDRVLAEIHLAGDRRLNSFMQDLRQDLDQSGARRLAERLALGLQASLLIRFRPPAIADAFCASRLAGVSSRTFGTLPPESDSDAVLAATV